MAQNPPNAFPHLKKNIYNPSLSLPFESKLVLPEGGAESRDEEEELLLCEKSSFLTSRRPHTQSGGNRRLKCSLFTSFGIK